MDVFWGRKNLLLLRWVFYFFYLFAKLRFHESQMKIMYFWQGCSGFLGATGNA